MLVPHLSRITSFSRFSPRDVLAYPVASLLVLPPSPFSVRARRCCLDLPASSVLQSPNYSSPSPPIIPVSNSVVLLRSPCLSSLKPRAPDSFPSRCCCPAPVASWSCTRFPLFYSEIIPMVLMVGVIFLRQLSLCSSLSYYSCVSCSCFSDVLDNVSLYSCVIIRYRSLYLRVGQNRPRSKL